MAEEGTGPPPSIASLRSKFENLAAGSNDARGGLRGSAGLSRSVSSQTEPSSRNGVLPSGTSSSDPAPALSKAPTLSRSTSPGPPFTSGSGSSEHVQEADRLETGAGEVHSVKSLMSRFGGSIAGSAGGTASSPQAGGDEQGGRTADMIATAGPSAVKRKPPIVQPKPVRLTRNPSSTVGLEETTQPKAPTIRRTSVDGHVESIPLSPLAATHTAGDPIASFSKEITSSPAASASNTPRATSPAPPSPSNSRAPSPKPPEPSRATKPSALPLGSAELAPPIRRTSEPREISPALTAEMTEKRTVRTPSPRPPEPDRSAKPPPRMEPPDEAILPPPGPSSNTIMSTEPPSSGQPLPSALPSVLPIPPPSAPPTLPARKLSSPTLTTAPPLPSSSRPKLVSVASAVMAAKAMSAPPPPKLPNRARGEPIVKAESLPTPPVRSGVAPPLAPRPAPSRTMPPTADGSEKPSIELPPPLRNGVPPPLAPRPLSSRTMPPATGLTEKAPAEIPAPARSRGFTLSVPDVDYQPPPPPSRTVYVQSTPPRRQDTRSAPPAPAAESNSEDEEDSEEGGATSKPTSSAKRMMEDHPDSTHANRRPPKFSPDIKIAGTANITAFAIHGRHVCTGTNYVKVYDTLMSDQPLFVVPLHDTGLDFRGRESRVTAMCFRPAGQLAEEGRYLWCGTKDGHLWELDIKTGRVADTRAFVHASQVVQIFRYKNWIMSLEESGKLHVFEVGAHEDDAPEDLRLIPQLCRTVRIMDKFNFAKLLGSRLWTSTGPLSRSTTSAASKGPTIRVYEPTQPGVMPAGRTAWTTEWTGAVTCATILPLQPDTVYLGHEGGYVSIWDAEQVVCQQVLKISTSDILAMEGVAERLWAGNRKGQIYVFDVTCKPWRTTNMWTAHLEHPLQQLMVDPWSIEHSGRFILWSLAKDSLRAWDGMLSVDWIDQQMVSRQEEYCDFRQIQAIICSWNIDSARPTDLAGSEDNMNFLPDLLGSVESPEIVAFGFQEVIPLTDKKLTAKTLLFGSGKHKDSNATADKISHAYRQWLDKLSMAVRLAYPNTAYVKIHSESLVGLFSCVFVKASEKELLTDVDVATVKRGIGGIYGNKGAIVARLVVDDTSICFINVHLAAGQSAKTARTADLGVIMEDKAILPVTGSVPFINGGDGTAIMDHELVILNGDLNYRIDQRRENVISSIHAGELPYLLEHDQLRKEMRTNHAFRLRSFEEAPITFDPTYKYNTGTSDYDTSDKKRIPAWCDRILYTKTSRLTCLHYKRDKVRKEVGKEWAKREAEVLQKIEDAYEGLI